jgi:prephenate dehydratase
VECSTFGALAAALASGEADACLMAIENSIAGSILTNYALLETHGFRITGEVYLRIEMNLMALPGQRLADITQVQSHPMALAQCQEFLAAHPAIRAVEGNDTAEVARDIARAGSRGVAAIASRLAAGTYGLEVLAAGIETNRQNYTRFLVISRGEKLASSGARIVRPADAVAGDAVAEDGGAGARASKASLRFEVAHRPGSLARVLELLAAAGVNLTKIQSVPILGRPYEYSFHVDLVWDEPAAYGRALDGITKVVRNLIAFGTYPEGERPSS